MVNVLTGLSSLVANNEDEYVELALKLASDFNALSDLRVKLRDLMLKSPLCDGSKFTRNLESAFRQMWRRYCNGDVPSLKNMAQLQQQQQLSPQAVPPESPFKFAEPSMVTTSRDGSNGTIMANGFNPGQSSTSSTLQGEENGSLSISSIATLSSRVEF